MSGSIPISSHGPWRDDADAEPQLTPSPSFARRAVLACARFVASDQVTAMLLAILAVALVSATIYEARHGAEFARWYFYDAGWFAALLATLAANLAANTLARFPWRLDDCGALAMRLGGVLLLVGVLRASLSGVEGQLIVADEKLVDTFLVPQRSLLAVSWANQPQVPDYRFEFTGGPVAWASHQSLDLGELDGMHARVLSYLPRARAVSQWKPDESGRGGAYVRFTIVPPGGVTPPAQELADEGYGDELVVGPLVVRLEQAVNRGFVDDFLAPTPRADRESRWGKAGQLRVYFENERQCLNVQDQLNERVPIGDTGVAIQIVRYLPHARPDAHGRFHPGGDDPKNPVVEIDVYLPGQEKPRRQLAFAKQPLLTLDGVAGSICPVKFRFDHPAVAPPAGVELLRVDRDTLWARVIQDGEHRLERVKSSSAKIKLAAGFELHVLDYLPYARREVHFESADVSMAAIQDDAAAMLGGDAGAILATPEYAAAAEVEIEFADARQRLWVSRNVPLEAAPVVNTAEGPLRVYFATATRPLGFQLGRAASRDDESTVDGAKPAKPLGEGLYMVGGGEQREPLELATGKTLRVGDLALHQRSVEDAGHGQQRVVLEVIRDPGRPWKYAGVLLACLGAAASAWRNRQGRAIAARRVTPVENSISTGNKTQEQASDDDDENWRTERRAA